MGFEDSIKKIKLRGLIRISSQILKDYGHYWNFKNVKLMQSRA